jgi:hypothetical protein
MRRPDIERSERLLAGVMHKVLRVLLLDMWSVSQGAEALQRETGPFLRRRNSVAVRGHSRDSCQKQPGRLMGKHQIHSNVSGQRLQEHHDEAGLVQHDAMH